jgi:ubiquitin-protein ligase
LNRLQKDPPAGIAAVPSDDNILIWHAFILGLVKRLIRKREICFFFKTK